MDLDKLQRTVIAKLDTFDRKLLADIRAKRCSLCGTTPAEPMPVGSHVMTPRNVLSVCELCWEPEKQIEPLLEHLEGISGWC